MTQDVGYSANASFWVKIMREQLDRYRNELTDPAVLSALGHADRLRILGATFADIARVLKPGGRLVILCLHPCFYWARRGLDETDPNWPDEYFEVQPRLQSFNVAGIESPSQVKAWYRPLEDYGAALARTGFLIANLQEPHPTVEQRQDPWWAAGWSKPMFLLITAVRSPTA